MLPQIPEPNTHTHYMCSFVFEDLPLKEALMVRRQIVMLCQMQHEINTRNLAPDKDSPRACMLLTQCHAPSPHYIILQDKTRQDKTRQDKTRHYTTSRYIPLHYERSAAEHHLVWCGMVRYGMAWQLSCSVKPGKQRTCRKANPVLATWANYSCLRLACRLRITLVLKVHVA